MRRVGKALAFFYGSVAVIAFLVYELAGLSAAAVVAALLLSARVVRDQLRLQTLRLWLRRAPHTTLSEGWPEGYDELYHHIKQLHGELAPLHTELAGQRALFDALPDSVVLLDSALRIVSGNQSAARLLGLRFPEDIGLPIVQVLRDQTFVRWLEQAQVVEPLLASSPKSSLQQLEHFRLPGPNDQTLLLSRDVTSAQRLETMRRDFVANVSHELKTPLTVVAGFAETLLELKLPAEQQRRYLRLIDEQAGNMRRLVDDLLMLSKLESADNVGEQSWFSLPDLVSALEAEAQSLSAGRHSITFTRAAAKLLGNRDEIHSALLNLISNAIRYTPAKGSITVTWQHDASGAWWRVADTGIGIAPEHLPRLTERFYRVDRGRSRETGGTGLGLAIVKHVLLRHDAQLSIDSEPGVGSTFSIYFPAHRVKLEQAPTTADEAVDTSRQAI